MPTTASHTSIIAEFDEETQVLLTSVDKACAAQMKEILHEVEMASLAGDTEYKMDLETMVWTKVIRAYGILMNRAIDAGWVTGVITEDK